MIVGLLVLQAVWIALSGRYPMAFDEDFHVGLIKIYSSHLSPFWSGHLEGSEAYGAISRDPSYLYHLFFGGVYKVIKSITSDSYYQIMSLRLFNIGLFAGGLFIFRNLLSKTQMTDRLVNYVLLVFVLIPVVPLLAAQINYDNLIFPLVGLILMLALDVSKSINQGSPNVLQILSFTLLILVTSLVKYAFLPIAAAVMIFILLYSRKSLKKYLVLRKFKNSYIKTNKIILLVLLLANLLFAGLFMERYGLNLVNYHKPVADCAEVLNYEKCQAYGPWIRDYNFEKAKPKNADTSLVRYMPEWFYGMWFRSFFSVDGPGTLNQTRGPLLLPAIVSIVFLAISPLIVLLGYKNILKKYSMPAIYLFSAVILVYIFSLWLEEFRLFRKTAQPVAINGRYLILIMPMLFGLIAMSCNVLLKNRLKYIIATTTVVMLIWGGGAMTYVLRSNSAWYWPSSNLINHVNWTTQRIVGPVTPGYYMPNLLQK